MTRTKPVIPSVSEGPGREGRQACSSRPAHPGPSLTLGMTGVARKRGCDHRSAREGRERNDRDQRRGGTDRNGTRSIDQRFGGRRTARSPSQTRTLGSGRGSSTASNTYVSTPYGAATRNALAAPRSISASPNAKRFSTEPERGNTRWLLPALSITTT